MLLIGKPSISMGHQHTMAMLVITRGYMYTVHLAPWMWPAKICLMSLPVAWKMPDTGRTVVDCAKERWTV